MQMHFLCFETLQTSPLPAYKYIIMLHFSHCRFQMTHTGLSEVCFGNKIRILQIHTDCGETFFTGPTGNITSPNYPGTFPSNTNCTYTIQVEPGQTVYLVFDYMELRDFLSIFIEGEDCLSRSWLYGAGLFVYDGVTANNDSLIGT